MATRWRSDVRKVHGHGDVGGVGLGVCGLCMGMVTWVAWAWVCVVCAWA